MGYRCPACDAPQADGEHLANHLAFTAMTRSGEHADWLDEHAPGWGDDSPAELAARVVEHADEVDVEMPDGTGTPPEPPAGTRGSAGVRSQFDGVIDAAVDEVLDEARELTEEMFREPDDGSASEARDEPADGPPETKEE